MNGLLAVFLLVFALLLSVLGAAFTNVWLCLYPVSVSQITELFLGEIQNK